VDASTPDPSPPWSQAGITDVPVARAFLDAVRSPATLVLPTGDGELGCFRTRQGSRTRGHSAAPCPSVIAATPPPADLVAHHRALGVGGARFVTPAVVSWSKPLAQLVLEDAELVTRLRADPRLSRIFVAFKDANAARLIERVGLAPAWCTPSPEAYANANDKLAFAQAATEFAFDVVPLEPAPTPDALALAFERLSGAYGEGCIVRLRRGAFGHGIHHARSRQEAQRAWGRLHPHGDVLVAPYLPPARVLRNVATHGIVTEGRFAPIVFSDQIIRQGWFVGGRVDATWGAEEIATIRRGLDAIARWLSAIGYTDAPAGVDGFLVREAGSLRFLALDPNIRLTATMLPWATVATLAEAAGRSFVWQFERRRVLGRALSLARLRRSLGTDLLRPDAVGQGGVLPSMIDGARLGFGLSILSVILVATDAEHLAHLVARVRRIGFGRG